MKVLGAVPVGLGVVFGIASTIAMGKLFSHGTPPSPPPVASAVLGQRSDSDADPEILRRLARIEAHQRQARQPSATAATPTTSAVSTVASQLPDDPGSHAKMVEARFSERIRQHREEPVDNAWAIPAQGALEPDVLNVLRDSGARLAKISCATVTCVADIEWTSKEEAERMWQALLRAPYSLQCSREIVLQDTDVAGSYTGSLLLNCEEDRVGTGDSTP